MNKTMKLATAFVVGVAIGAAATYSFLRLTYSSVPRGWIVLAIDGSGFGWESSALFNVDIALPEVGEIARNSVES
jgi:hypothetical protein